MLSISASSWKLVKQHHSKMIQQPLSQFTVCHKMGLGKQQCLEEKEPTQRITAGEQYQKEQGGMILTWLLRSRLDDLIGGFQCPSFPMELQGSAAQIQPPQLNKCLCMDWTTPSAPACTSAASSHLSDETMVPLWLNPRCYFTSGRSLCRTSGGSPWPFRTGSKGSKPKSCFLSVTQENTHTVAAHQRSRGVKLRVFPSTVLNRNEIKHVFCDLLSPSISDRLWPMPRWKRKA